MVDLAQAAIGPGMEVFCRFSQVLERDGTRMTVRDRAGADQRQTAVDPVGS